MAIWMTAWTHPRLALAGTTSRRQISGSVASKTMRSWHDPVVRSGLLAAKSCLKAIMIPRCWAHDSFVNSRWLAVARWVEWLPFRQQHGAQHFDDAYLDFPCVPERPLLRSMGGYALWQRNLPSPFFQRSWLRSLDFGNETGAASPRSARRIRNAVNYPSDGAPPSPEG